MNTMEDKELQELFAAKRTVEANRRRQEALRRMLEADGEATAPRRKVRPLWPVWTGAAAAVVALLLMTLPALFVQEESAPMLVAEAEVPEVQPAPAREVTVPTAPAAPQHTKPAKAEKTETIGTIDTIGAIGTIGTIDTIGTIILEEAAPAVTVPADVAPTPRVMRRTSTLIACTEGCKAPEGTPETSSRNLQINFFNNDNYADATIYSIPINK